jgi:hypothetical protein
MIKAYNSLTAKEKQHVLFSLFLVALVVATISILFNITRGADVDYFKERLILTEARLNSIDKKVDDMRDKTDRQLEALKDRTNETARKVEEQEKWIEEWKKLPHLPKPKR